MDAASVSTTAPADERAEGDSTGSKEDFGAAEMQVDGHSLQEANKGVIKPAKMSGLNSAWASVFGNLKTNLKQTISEQSNSDAGSRDKSTKKKAKIVSESVGGPVRLSKAARSEKRAREEADNGVCKDPVKR